LSKKKVLLKGPILTVSGYGEHCRQVFKALQKRQNIDLYVEPTNWGNTSWVLNHEYDNSIVKDILEFAKKPSNNVEFDESLQVLLPDEWRNLAKNNIGVTAGFEADIVKSSWIDEVNKMSKVIVPSEFTKAAFAKTSKKTGKKLYTEIKVINEAYFSYIDDYKDSSTDVLMSLEYDKNIFIISQVTSNDSRSDRKNIIKTIKCALEFVKDKDIGVVLKINYGKHTKSEFKKIKILLQNEFNKDRLDKITMLFGNATIKDLVKVYKSSKISCMLTGSRAEGFGLPILEAAACGLPVIATNYSAYKEFMLDNFIKIDYDLVNFDHDSRFVDLSAKPKWSDFKSESMIRCLECFFKNEEKYRKSAVYHQNFIKQNYCIENIIDNYINFFKSGL
jgi:glycosyltransferase involved in cell wall biosynthesis